MKKPELRTALNYDMRKAGAESALHCPEPTRTKQSFKEECDINTIVKRFGLTGELPTGIRAPSYGDYEGINDFKTAMDTLAQAGEAFDQLPATWRKRFNHDPQEFLEFCSKEENRPEAIKLGLVMPAATALATTAPATSPSPAASDGPTGGKTGDNPKGVT